MATRLTAYIVSSIVVLTLIAGLIVRAQRDNEGPIDLMVVNGRVFTADGRGTMAEAVAVQGNRIVRVGTTREVLRMRRPQTEVIDAGGNAVVPGFNDAHLHFLSGGLGLHQVNLQEATTVDEVRDTVAAWAEANPDSAWVRGRGWYYTTFAGGLPTRQMLDAIVADRPAWLTAYDGHSGWANSKALELAGITRRTPNPPGGIIEKDPRTGEPTGVLKETAMRLMAGVLPETTREERLQALGEAVDEAHRLGVTSVQNASGSLDEFELYDDLREAGDLDVRVYSAISVGPDVTAGDYDRFDAIRERFSDDPLFKVGAIKLMVDGVIEGHTAAMLAPYADRPESAGEARFTPERLTEVVTELDRRGWQIMIHAIGDRGVRMALDAFEHAAEVNPAPERGRRHRIEHIETIDPADIPRFAELGVAASYQPYHGLPSPEGGDVWSTAIGPERAARGWIFATLHEAGARLVFGSDWPVVSMDPRFGLHVAVNRTTLDGEPEGGLPPEERLGLETALEAYTRAGAWASFDDLRKGAIAPDMLADIVILSTDIFDETPTSLLHTAVDVTIFDGKVVHRRTGARQTSTN
ncbi:MAG: amidohydrolase [Vicinamibacteria bacterium]